MIPISLANSADPDVHNVTFHLGLHCFPLSAIVRDGIVGHSTGDRRVATRSSRLTRGTAGSSITGATDCVVSLSKTHLSLLSTGSSSTQEGQS